MYFKCQELVETLKTEHGITLMINFSLILNQCWSLFQSAAGTLCRTFVKIIAASSKLFILFVFSLCYKLSDESHLDGQDQDAAGEKVCTLFILAYVLWRPFSLVH